MSRMLHRTRIGRRGAFLLFLSLLDFVYGYSLLFPSPRSLINPADVFLTRICPLWVWGSLWLLVSVVCFINAFRYRDFFGFAAGMFIKVLWGVTFLLGQIFADVERGYLSAAIWLSFAGVLALISTWPDELKMVPGEKSNG